MARWPPDQTKPTAKPSPHPPHEKTSIMLVLTRKETQTIRIGDDIVIRIVHAGATSVKIGIEAPRDIQIVRGELVADGTKEPLARDADSFSVRDLTMTCVEAA
jgi:carbon storage regulator